MGNKTSSSSIVSVSPSDDDLYCSVSNNTDNDNDNTENNNSSMMILPGDSASTRSWKASASAESTRSWKSWKSNDETSSVPSSSLHSNLMRSQHHRDPMRYYQVIQVLGEGSMGSVAKVKKRDRAKGGSARKDFVIKEKGCCFPVLSFCTLKANAHKFEAISPLAFNSDGTKSTVSTSGCCSPPSEEEQQQRTKKFSKSKNRRVLKHQASSTSSMITYGPKKDTFYALKSIHLDRCTNPEYKFELKNEVEILKGLDHPHIVRAIETFNYHDRLFIVLELCNGGDLYTRDPYTEAQAVGIVRSLLSAVAYLHDHNIVHRDLKYENIMFSDTSPKATLKLIDFGLSQKFARNEHLKDAVGTVYTMAPELLAGDYDEKADIWSIGVITFMLLSSSMPFYGRDRMSVIKKIVSGKFKFSSKRWKYVEADAKVFVRDLLEVDPVKRPSADRALKLSWLDQDASENAGEAYWNNVMDNVQANIQAFSEYSQLKKLALMVIAYKSTSDEIGDLRKIFTKYDKLNNGIITLPEFKEALSERYSYSDEELETMFHGIDIDGTGTVHYSEFLAATLESHGSIDEERLAEAFDRIDSDDTGYITVPNLKDFLGDEMPTEYLNKIIDEADNNQDHRISYDEFLSLWNVDSDEKLEMARVQVNAKRKLDRVSSRLSNISSLSGGDMTESESERAELRSQVSTVTNPSGTYYFEKRKKEASVRDAWV